MNRRQLGIIFGALAILIVIYAIGRLGSPGASRQLGSGIPTDAAIDTSTSLIRILHADPADSVRLEYTAGAWLVNGHAADTLRIRRLIGVLDTTRVWELVARSPDNHARLGVDETSASEISIDGKLTFLFGSSDRGLYYARLPDSQETYLFPMAAGELLRDRVEPWRDHVIAAMDSGSVRRIAITRSDAELALTRVAEGWMLGDELADSVRVRDLLRQIVRLSATGFASESVALGLDFEHPDAVLDLYTDEWPDETTGPALSLRFLESTDEDSYLLRRADRLEVYEMPEWAVRRVLPERDELLPEPGD